MATEIVMPRLSDTMETGTIAKWLKQEGDAVKRGETIAEIETDKANMELESYASGILANISVKEGESAGVGEPIAVVAADENEAKTLQGSNGKPPAEQPEPAREAVRDQTPPSQGPPAAPQGDGRVEPEERVKASPLARRLAQEHGIELGDVAGTGPAGRITKEDVQSFLKQTAPAGRPPTRAGTRLEAPKPAPEAARPRPQPAPQAASVEAQRHPQPVEMSRMQHTIARRMTEARFSIPDFVLTAEYDLTDARQLLKQISATEGAAKVGPNDLLIKAVATALRRHPEVNAGWENEAMVRYDRINVGFAVALPDGLVVPVVKDADTKALGEISTEAKDLRDRARAGKLPPGDYEGGTFTVSNLGMYGIDQFTPIINPPEACIMGVGAISQKPVVLDGQTAVRDRMRVTLACDHRVVYGAQGAEFLQTLRELLENPMLVLI